MTTDTKTNAPAGDQPMARKEPVTLDEQDLKILRLLQRDATPSLDRLATKVGLSKTSVWNRIQRLQQHGVILRQAAVLDPSRVGLTETFFIAIRTSNHNAEWLAKFSETLRAMPEITEAHRLAGDVDYLLKVQVPSTREFDELYQRLVASIDLSNVTSSLSMEVLKYDTALPI